jgi:hypothetical protein
LALAPFKPPEGGLTVQEPIRVEKENFDQVLSDFEISLQISLPKNLCPSGGLTLNLKRLKDFHPDRLIENVPFLRNILEARNFVEEAKTKGLHEEEIYRRLKAWPDLPLEIRWEPRKPERSPITPMDDILKMVAMPEERSSGETQSFMGQLDSLLQTILRHIFLDESLRKLESTWRGLRFLIEKEKADGTLLLEIIPVSFDTLEETLNHLMVHLIEDLPSLVLLDLPFDNSPRSLELLEKIALFSETLLVPTSSWITPKFFYLDTWREMDKLAFLPHYLQEPVFAKWRRFKKTPSSRWVALTCNRFLLRYPYGPDHPPSSIYFEEPENLWLSPVWALGSLISQSLLKTGWPTRFMEWQNIRLIDLALRPIAENQNLPTEALFSEERISQFLKEGMLPLVSISNKDIAFIPGDTTVGNGSLSYQLFLSRVSQFLFWCKERIGGDLDPAEIERALQEAFALLWERTGHQSPRNLEVSVTRPGPEKPALVRIVIEPSRQILPSGEKVELELNW